MAFTDLPITAQNLVSLGFEMSIKKFIIIYAFILSAIYIFYWHKNKEDTPYLMLALWRTLLYSASVVYFYTLPINMFLVAPKVEVDVIFRYMIVFYVIMMIVLGIIMFINILFFGSSFILKLGGMDVSDERTGRIARKLFGDNYKYIEGLNVRKLWRGR